MNNAFKVYLAPPNKSGDSYFTSFHKCLHSGICSYPPLEYKAEMGAPLSTGRSSLGLPFTHDSGTLDFWIVAIMSQPV